MTCDLHFRHNYSSSSIFQWGTLLKRFFEEPKIVSSVLQTKAFTALKSRCIDQTVLCIFLKVLISSLRTPKISNKHQSVEMFSGGSTDERVSLGHRC